MNLSDLVYQYIPAWLMALAMWLVALANAYQAGGYGYSRRWQKRIKAFTWWLMGAVYFYEFIFSPPPGEARVLFRLAIGLLVLSELAYHFDTIIDIAEVIVLKAKRRVRDGPTDNS